MIQSLSARLTLIVVILVAALISFLPNMVDVGENWVFSQQKINYGLDIRGGLHLVMGVDVDGVLEEKTNRLSSTLEEFFKTEGTPVQKISVTGEGSNVQLTVNLKQAADMDSIRALIGRSYASVLQEIDASDISVTLKYTDLHRKTLTEGVIGQAIEIIRNRVDAKGVGEPSITAQGNDRILIQLPGIENATETKELINKTAKLEFQMVAQEVPAELATWIEEAEKAGQYDVKSLTYAKYIQRLNKDLKAKLPEKTEIVFQKDPSVKSIEDAKIPYLLKTDTGLGGDDLKDAFVAYDEYNNPIVSLSFNPLGSKKFADLTGANINRQMAIVLDRVVYTAPSIQDRIAGGNAQITLGAGEDYQSQLDEAKTIALALRAGALPASLEQLEERTIGPSLGEDSIKAGKVAIMVGGIFVLIFMLVYYRGYGVIANIALILNIFFILALLTALGATLTLPGIAGIALTIGMAVDANVIIFERIKEEIARGQNFRKATQDGFAHAFSAIFDANITTAVVCIILMYFGSGPVRGFAVTLLCGLATSMFTAIFVSRTFMDLIYNRFKWKKLAI